MLSVKRGKLGDAVGYNVSNSNTKERQGWRIYQPVVKNPQTQGQLWQRIKLAAVNNQYRAVKEIIQRGFEGQEYGDPSRRAWLSMALGSQFDGPWLNKGEMTAAPLRDIPLTVGSLPEVTITYEAEDKYFVTSIPALNQAPPMTVAELTQCCVAAGYREGDQFTIIQCQRVDNRAFSWHVWAIYLDSADTRSLTSVGLDVDYTSTASGNFLINFYLTSLSGGLTNRFAQAITISRDGDGSHLRSTSRLCMRPDMDEYLYSEVAKINAGLSYVRNKAKSENWQQVPTRSAAAGSYVLKAADGTTFTAASTSFTGGYAVIVSDTGEEYYVHCTDVKSLAYNRWLVAKSGATLDAVWKQAAPFDPAPPSDSVVNLITSTDATEENLQVYYFLLSQGFDARAIMGGLPQ